MTIGEVKQLKDEMEENIRVLLRQFTEQTELTVASADVYVHGAKDCRGRTLFHDYIVTVEVNL